MKRWKPNKTKSGSKSTSKHMLRYKEQDRESIEYAKRSGGRTNTNGQQSSYFKGFMRLRVEFGKGLNKPPRNVCMQITTRRAPGFSGIGSDCQAKGNPVTIPDLA